eukprot:5778705-Amphidinium_carterae.1
MQRRRKHLTIGYGVVRQELSDGPVEAEPVALTTGVSEGTYFRNLLFEPLGFDSEAQGSIPLHVQTDSEAARRIALRAGVMPKVKHLGVRAFHCQEVFEEGRAHLHKVAGDQPGVSIPPDLFAKLVTVEWERVGPGESEQKGRPKAKEAEVQWTRLEKGRLFKDFKMRGRHGCFGRSFHCQPHNACRRKTSRDSPEENSYDVSQWTFHDAVNDVFGMLPRLVLCKYRKRWTEKEMTTSQAVIERNHDRVRILKKLGVKEVTTTTISEST